MDNSVPISTQWLLDAVGETGRTAIKSVYLIACPKTKSKGTGFLLRSGYLITNRHVIEDCSATEIFALSSISETISFQEVISDESRDLSLLKPAKYLGEGLEVVDQSIEVGTKVSTWGYPLGYSGPSPILAVGYLAGFRDHRKDVISRDVISRIVKRYVINAAFNPGNSGGPLFISGSDKVIGVVVAKHAPITPFLASAIEALSKNVSGIAFTGTNEEGNKVTFVESQLVAMVLNYFRDMTQVVIGEAIAGSELIAFLKVNKIGA